MDRGRIVALTVAALVAAGPAKALDYQVIPLDNTRVAITASGEVTANEYDRFGVFFKQLMSNYAHSRIVLLMLDSPGGNLYQGWRLADLIHQTRIPVAVPPGGMCASACFLMFAASPVKFAAPDAAIGVHSAGNGLGQDTPMAMAATTALARDLAGYGVPAAIIGQLVTTGPGTISWLTVTQLAAMHVTMVPNTAPMDTAPAAPVSAPAPAAAIPPQMTNDRRAPDSAFQDGLHDRTGLENWFASLSDWTKLGAADWIAIRSTPAAKQACNTAHLQVARPDAGPSDILAWRDGCIRARAILAGPDHRRTTEPDYRTGWNSYQPG